jgi:hypothetical protein
VNDTVRRVRQSHFQSTVGYEVLHSKCKGFFTNADKKMRTEVHGRRQVIASSLSLFCVPRAVGDDMRPHEYNIITRRARHE